MTEASLVKSIVLFATVHEYQIRGSNQNSQPTRRLDYLRSRLGAQIVMEEWANKHGQSVAAEWAATLGLHWANVGTPDEPEFRTYTGPINYPGHDGSLQPPDWDAPGMSEYGPFENQEAREIRMVENVRREMERFENGFFLLGLAHLHSLSGRLRSAGFETKGFSWL
jgi:hypothetical protein